MRSGERGWPPRSATVYDVGASGGGPVGVYSAYVRAFFDDMLADAVLDRCIGRFRCCIANVRVEEGHGEQLAGFI